MATAPPPRLRFAPSPTGRLHLGHAYSAWVNAWRAETQGGTFLLRIEDLDPSRCCPEHEVGIVEDLTWLGLRWQGPPRRQSEHLPLYREALDRLSDQGLLYPCTCRRRDILEKLEAQYGQDLPYGPDGLVYPGTCRGRPMEDRPPGAALRLDMERAVARLGAPLTFREEGPLHSGLHTIEPQRLVREIGDVVLQRRDTGMPAYHLAVVVDDAAQGITEVIRGTDLFEATPIHVLLQHLLGLPTPRYHHHALIRDAAGKRLAKSHDSRAIATYRAAGESPAQVWARVAAQQSEVTPPSAP